MYRHGDLLIVEIDAIPEGAVPVAPEADGSLILARGEATGHAHRVIGGDARLIRGGDGAVYLALGSPAEVRHEQHAPIGLASGSYQIIRQREYHPAEIRVVAD